MKFWHVMAAAILSTAASAYAAPLSFSFQYLDGVNEGFNDATYGAQRRAALEYAASIWSNRVNSSYTDETVRIGVVMNPLSGTSPISGPQTPVLLYSVGPTGGALRGNTMYGMPLAEHLLKTNVNGTANDYSMTFDTNAPLYLGLDRNPGVNEFDFVTSGLRAIARTLALQTRIDINLTDATPGIGSFYPINSPAAGGTVYPPGIYDTFLVTGSGLSLLSMTDAERATAITSGDLYWNGVKGIAANGGVRPKLNAPNPVTGSSVFYLDAMFDSLTSQPAPQQGQVRDIDPILLGILADVGWDVNAVSEPSTYAMLLTGLGLLGLGMRRKRA